MARADAISTIRGHLQGYTRPDDSGVYFAKVYQQTPRALAPFDKLCIFYQAGEGELPDAYRSGTFRTAFTAERWIVKCFWLPRAQEGAREALLLEQWDAKRGIQALLRGDSQLGGNVSDLKIRRVDQQPEQFGENAAEFDVLTIEFDTWDLVGEAISA